MPWRVVMAYYVRDFDSRGPSPPFADVWEESFVSEPNDATIQELTQRIEASYRDERIYTFDFHTREVEYIEPFAPPPTPEPPISPPEKPRPLARLVRAVRQIGSAILGIFRRVSK